MHGSSFAVDHGDATPPASDSTSGSGSGSSSVENASVGASVIGHLIGGAIVTPDEPSTPVHNPATGESIRRVLFASAQTVKAAVSAAEQAFPAWRATPPLKRARVMSELKTLLEKHAPELIASITEEHGKVTLDAAGELQRGIENVEFASYAPQLLKGEHSRNVGPQVDSWSEFQPLGVTAGITPFNFPAMVPLWMWPMAIACGNTFVLKPSELAPSCALKIAELALKAGLPPGVLNVVQGDKLTASAVLDDERAQAISFVGSTNVAEHIYNHASRTSKRVQALGGAKNHAVVMPDADIDNCVSALLGAAFGSCGQRCMAIALVVAVGDAVADALVGKLSAALAALRVGAGTDPQSEMGPLVSAAARERVMRYLDIGVREGARLCVDGRLRPPPQGYEKGFFIGPSLFDEVTPSMAIAKDEIFGPVLGIVRAQSLEDAISMINEHAYGNGTCIFTQDGRTARAFSDRVAAGMVGINVPLPVPVASHSFGGWKRSLFGDLCAYGPDAVRFYTRRKTITERWPSSSTHESASYAFPASKP